MTTDQALRHYTSRLKTSPAMYAQKYIDQIHTIETLRAELADAKRALKWSREDVARLEDLAEERRNRTTTIKDKQP